MSPNPRRNHEENAENKLTANCNNWYQTMPVQIIQTLKGKSKEILSEKKKQEEKDQNKTNESDRSPYNVLRFKINDKSAQKLAFSDAGYLSRTP